MEFFGINGSEFIVLLVIAAIVLGPERLPRYAQQLGRLIRELRRMAQGASAQMRDELGPEFDEIDWRKLDPRQYDPRRIVREALSDSSVDPDDPLGLRGAGIDRQSLGIGREDVGLGRSNGAANGMKPVSPGGPGARRAAVPPAQGDAAPAAGADDVPLDPDAT